MKFSKFFITTQKEAPKDAILPSHILLIRAGFISQTGSGIYDILPLGKIVLDKIQHIIKDELDRAGAIELKLGLATPISYWKESGRENKYGKELITFEDRKANKFVLSPTNEEAIVNLIKNKITSYKQLPINLYQINTKFRDEVRPRFGLLRSREFLMKDGYSFHQNEACMENEFLSMENCYKKILDKLELKYKIVNADSGAIGGSGSKEFMVLTENGEDKLIVCNSCEYGANIETAQKRVIDDKYSDYPKAIFNTFHTPNVKTIKQLSEFFKVDTKHIVKSVALKAYYDNHNEIVVVFLRGDDELQMTKVKNALCANELVDASDKELKESNIISGFIGPVGLCDTINIILDNALYDGSGLICGANKEDYHFIGVNLNSINKSKFFDISSVMEGDLCPKCNESLFHKKGIEIGHIFQLKTVYSDLLKANFLDENGRQKPFFMGTYGIGISRIMASMVEQNYDKSGLIWTKQTAPFLVDIIISNTKDEEQVGTGNKIYEELKEKNINVILDDRKERFGVKISDFELIGFFCVIIIGKNLKNGMIEFITRSDLKKIDLSLDDVISHTTEVLK